MKKTTNKLHVLIAYQYLSFKGGIEEVIYNQSKRLKEDGHNVTLLTSHYAKNEKNISRDGVKIIRIPSINFTYKMFGIPFAMPIISVRNILKMRSAMRKADVINVHGHPYVASFIYIIVAKTLNKPVVITQHNTNIESNSVLINTMYTLFDKTIGRYNLGSADKIIAVSKNTKQYIETVTNNTNIEVVYNGVDTKRFTPTNKKALLRKKYGVPVNKFVCLTVRRLTFKNGIETFLESAKHADQKNTLFLLGGTGPDKNKIAEYIASNKLTNVRMLGFVSDEDLASLYALSDVFILPSIQGEGFPMVVLEAFSAGAPVIATKSGGHVEIIKNGETGYLVDINKPLAISKHVNMLIKNRTLMKKMSANCRKLVVKNLSWKQNMKQLIQAFELAV